MMGRRSLERHSGVLALAALLATTGCHVPAAANPAYGPTPSESPEPVLVPLSADLSAPDATGARTARIVFPDMPVHVSGGSEAYLYKRRYLVTLPAGTHIEEVASFIGVDRGDVVEVGVDVYSIGSYNIYQRSLHKESGLTNFDGWSSAPADYTVGDPIVIALACRVTGRNAVSGRLEASVLYEVRLSISPPPPPPGS
jgi:hypothetical protein